MENFLDHMIFVCFSFVGLGLLIVVPCFLIEKLDEKFNWNLAEKVAIFFTNDNED